jgi:DNA polymerase-3 subunit epsilon
LQPSHNRSLRRNDEQCFWQLVEARQGEWHPQLVPFQRALPAQLDKLYGPFKTAREAKKCCRNWRATHHLCHALLGLEKLKPGKPCFAHQVHQCKGACVGKEPVSFHSAR